jgi:hypothetical protein
LALSLDLLISALVVLNLEMVRRMGALPRKVIRKSKHDGEGHFQRFERSLCGPVANGQVGRPLTVPRVSVLSSGTSECVRGFLLKLAPSYIHATG